MNIQASLERGAGFIHKTFGELKYIPSPTLVLPLPKGGGGEKRNPHLSPRRSQGEGEDWGEFILSLKGGEDLKRKERGGL